MYREWKYLELLWYDINHILVFISTPLTPPPNDVLLVFYDHVISSRGYLLFVLCIVSLYL